jgi:hypothetical protein
MAAKQGRLWIWKGKKMETHQCHLVPVGAACPFRGVVPFGCWGIEAGAKERVESGQTFDRGRTVLPEAGRKEAILTDSVILDALVWTRFLSE